MTNRISEIKQELEDLYYKFRDTLPEAHQTYFDRSFDLLLKSEDRIAQFYGTYKVHKEKLSVLPVISCCGTFAKVFSKYINHWLKKMFRPSFQRT